MADRPVLPLSTCCRTIVLGLAVLCGLAVPSAPGLSSELRRTPIVEAVQAAQPSVVSIRGEKRLAPTGADVAGDNTRRRVNGMGTGVVIDPRGYIITNHHVIDGVRQIRVTTADGDQYTARLISRDPETDLAIIKIDPVEPLPVIKIGTSQDLMPAEPVVAVGNAYGYDHTVTRGIISALHRPVQVSDAQFYDDLIQTDASINPGNSGGPLLNIDGEMIGINVAVREGAHGIGFAIPIDQAVAVAAKLLANHTLQKIWHGAELATEPSPAGPMLVVRSVAPQSPAEQAGLKPGDVITKLDGLAVARALDFHRAVLDLDAGDQMELLVERGQETLETTLQLAEVPGSLKPAVSPYWELLGLELEPVPADELQQNFRTQYRGGLSVTAVRPHSPAAKQGIRRGDVLLGMHLWETVSLENVDYIVNRSDLASFNPVKFYILRGNRIYYGNLPIPVAMRTTNRG